MFTGAVLGISLVGSIGSMMGVFYTPPEKTVQKHLFWLVSDFSCCLLLSFLYLLCRLSGLQRMSSSYIEPVVFCRSAYLVSCRTLHMRCRWRTFIRWSYSQVSPFICSGLGSQLTQSLGMIHTCTSVDLFLPE